MNQVAVEALYSATYVENYLDSVENLPDDAQKYFSRIRELDIQYRSELERIPLYITPIINHIAFPPQTTFVMRTLSTSSGPIARQVNWRVRMPRRGPVPCHVCSRV